MVRVSASLLHSDDYRHRGGLENEISLNFLPLPRTKAELDHAESRTSTKEDKDPCRRGRDSRICTIIITGSKSSKIVSGRFVFSSGTRTTTLFDDTFCNILDLHLLTSHTHRPSIALRNKRFAEERSNPKWLS